MYNPYSLPGKFYPCIWKRPYIPRILSKSGNFYLGFSSCKFQRLHYRQQTSYHSPSGYKIHALLCHLAIFYFQDEFFDAANKKEELPTMAMHHYFRTFVVFQRNENPASIIFITFNSSPVSPTLYIAVTLLHMTSSFHALSPINATLICATCGTRIVYETNTVSDSNWRKVHQHFSDLIPVSNLVNRPWDTNRISSFYACGIPPKRLISGGYPRAQNCLYRVIKQKYNWQSFEQKKIYGSGNISSNDGRQCEYAVSKKRLFQVWSCAIQNSGGFISIWPVHMDLTLMVVFPMKTKTYTNFFFKYIFHSN